MPVNWGPTVYPTGAVPGQAAPIANRFLGRFDGGHPTGNFLLGDWTIDFTTPGIWLVTTAPTTWTNVVSSGGGVTTFNTRSGAVTLQASDLTALMTLLASDASITVTGTTLAPSVSRAALTGDITASAGSNATVLKNTGPGATGPIGSATVTPVVTIDAQGRVTALTSANISASAAIPVVWAKGDQSGNAFSTSSTTDTDITGASALWSLSTGGTNANGVLSIAAAVSDVLELQFFGALSGATDTYLSVNVGGTAVTSPSAIFDSITNNLAFSSLVVVTGGMISGGNVACKPQWHVGSTTATMFNRATSNPISPFFSVKNLKH